MNNKKVEILTFHWTINFGGLLQAYALQETLKEMGYDPSFINYYNKSELASVSNWKRRILQVGWDKIARLFFGREKREKITEGFRKNYLNIQNNKYESYEALVLGYQDYSDYAYAYIVGSDQVWNPNLTGNPDAYLFSFLPNNVRKISYAASFGKASIPEKTKDKFATELLKFKAVSVRENDGSKLINKISGINASVVMDPVFLLPSEQWNSIAFGRIVEGDYILCYYMNTLDATIHPAISLIASTLAQKYNCKVINIGKKEFEKLKFWENNLFDIGPLDFLSLVANAKFVVTNSFHATAFSIIFHIPFFSPINYEEPKDERLSNRIESLLEKLYCADRIIACPVNETNVAFKLNELDHMNFDEVDKSLLELRSESLAFLCDALAESMGGK